MADLRERQRAAAELLAAEAALLRAFDWIPYVVDGKVMWSDAGRSPPELCDQGQAITLIRARAHF